MHSYLTFVVVNLKSGEKLLWGGRESKEEGEWEREHKLMFMLA